MGKKNKQKISPVINGNAKNGHGKLENAFYKAECVRKAPGTLTMCFLLRYLCYNLLLNLSASVEDLEENYEAEEATPKGKQKLKKKNKIPQQEEEDDEQDVAVGRGKQGKAFGASLWMLECKDTF